MKHYLFLALLALWLPGSVFAQNKQLDSLFKAFSGRDFDQVVLPAKQALEQKQKEVIPALIQLLQNPEQAKLYYSQQLMYPGSKRVVEENEIIVPYELDWISVRAGWLLEEICFKDFGYRSLATLDPSFEEIKHHNRNEENEQIYAVDWQNRLPQEQINQSRKKLATAVASWWEQNKNEWTRVKAIKEALQSNNEYFIGKALDFISDYAPYKNSCDNFFDAYPNEIRPLIVLLKHSLFKSLPEKLEDFWSVRGDRQNQPQP